jgi:hypothetical protein
MIDALGWELLQTNSVRAPFLTSLIKPRLFLSAGFPSTTAVSLSSLGTGYPPGQHGFVGLTMALPDYDRPFDVLTWRLVGRDPDAQPQLPVPEQIQPRRTLFEKAVRAGSAVTAIGPIELAGTAFSRAVLRGGHYRGSFSFADLVAQTAEVMRDGTNRHSPGTTFVYAYHAELDTLAHLRGTESEAWKLHLEHVDRMVLELAERMPPDTLLAVTGDHGIVDLVDSEQVDVARHPFLLDGVRFIAGEPRARHVYCLPGAEADVLATWQGVLGGAMWILSREEAVLNGWFGPVTPQHRSRIGDVVAAACGGTTVVDSKSNPKEAQLLAYHGSLTSQEQLVPLILVHR